MLQHHLDMTSSDRQGWRILLRLAALPARAFALVAASVGVNPAALKTSPSTTCASAAADKCTAQILKGSKFYDLSERYNKYAYKNIKGRKNYRKVIVTARRKVK